MLERLLNISSFLLMSGKRAAQRKPNQQQQAQQKPVVDPKLQPAKNEPAPKNDLDPKKE